MPIQLNHHTHICGSVFRDMNYPSCDPEHGLRGSDGFSRMGGIGAHSRHASNLRSIIHRSQTGNQNISRLYSKRSFPHNQDISSPSSFSNIINIISDNMNLTEQDGYS
jgi:hypothetical protein